MALICKVNVRGRVIGVEALHAIRWPCRYMYQVQDLPAF